MTPVLLDTDIGSDIDDALTLAYLLRKPDCELLGVTTGTGETAKRAALAKWICDAAGKADIPVIAGLEGPLLTGPGQPFVQQYEAFKGNEGETRFKGDDLSAIDFMRRTIRDRPNEITLLAIGPMTNLGALFAADPEIPRLLKRIVLMLGTFGQTFPGRLCHTEWNAHCDPTAAAIVFQRAIPGTLISVGLDVTLECKLPLTQFWSRFEEGDPVHDAVVAMAKIWAKDTDHVTFHDPLAAALIFTPELCELEPGFVDVDLSDGATRWKPSQSGPHQICVSVEPFRFFQEYFSVVSKK